MTEIREVDYGVANNYGDYIEVNKHLKAEFPKLYQQIINHELAHTNDKSFNLKDLALDLNTKINNKQLLIFMMRHPKAFLQLIPIYRLRGIWYYDINMIITWSISLLIILLVVYFLVY